MVPILPSVFLACYWIQCAAVPEWAFYRKDGIQIVFGGNEFRSKRAKKKPGLPHTESKNMPKIHWAEYAPCMAELADAGMLSPFFPRNIAALYKETKLM